MKAASSSTINEYIAGFPKNVQAILQKIRGIIAKAAPDAEEAMKYQIPTFVQEENLVHFAAFQKHIGFYPSPSAIAAFAGKLADYKSAKGSVQFPLDQPMPLALIQEMVEFRVREIREKSATRKKKK